MPISSRSSESRGRGWVVAQFALMALIAAAWFLPPRWPEGADRSLDVLGVCLALAGAALAGWAVRALGESLTTLPAPRAGAALVQSGPYRWVRHPIYCGGLLLFGGLSLVFSVPALLLTGALALLWQRKASLEERLLVERYPNYASYRRRTFL